MISDSTLGNLASSPIMQQAVSAASGPLGELGKKLFDRFKPEIVKQVKELAPRSLPSLEKAKDVLQTVLRSTHDSKLPFPRPTHNNAQRMVVPMTGQARLTMIVPAGNSALVVPTPNGVRPIAVFMTTSTLPAMPLNHALGDNLCGASSVEPAWNGALVNTVGPWNGVATATFGEFANGLDPVDQVTGLSRSSSVHSSPSDVLCRNPCYNFARGKMCVQVTTPYDATAAVQMLTPSAMPHASQTTRFSRGRVGYTFGETNPADNDIVHSHAAPGLSSVEFINPFQYQAATAIDVESILAACPVANQSGNEVKEYEFHLVPMVECNYRFCSRVRATTTFVPGDCPTSSYMCGNTNRESIQDVFEHGTMAMVNNTSNVDISITVTCDYGYWVEPGPPPLRGDGIAPGGGTSAVMTHSQAEMIKRNRVPTELSRGGEHRNIQHTTPVVRKSTGRTTTAPSQPRIHEESKGTVATLAAAASAVLSNKQVQTTGQNLLKKAVNWLSDFLPDEAGEFLEGMLA